MRYIQTMSRSAGTWRTICITNDPNPDVDSDDAIEVYYAMKKGSPMAFGRMRIIDDAGRVVEGEGSE